MTWQEFKEAIEAAGVKDDDEIWYIDVSFPTKEDFEAGQIHVGRDEKMGITVA
jgi:hypothetical protein